MFQYYKTLSPGQVQKIAQENGQYAVIVQGTGSDVPDLVLAMGDRAILAWEECETLAWFRANPEELTQLTDILWQYRIPYLSAIPNKPGPFGINFPDGFGFHSGNRHHPALWFALRDDANEIVESVLSSSDKTIPAHFGLSRTGHYFRAEKIDWDPRLETIARRYITECVARGKVLITSASEQEEMWEGKDAVEAYLFLSKLFQSFSCGDGGTDDWHILRKMANDYANQTLAKGSYPEGPLEIPGKVHFYTGYCKGAEDNPVLRGFILDSFKNYAAVALWNRRVEPFRLPRNVCGVPDPQTGEWLRDDSL